MSNNDPFTASSSSTGLARHMPALYKPASRNSIFSKATSQAPPPVSNINIGSSSDVVNRRFSVISTVSTNASRKTADDFEEALRGGGTLKLRSSRDDFRSPAATEDEDVEGEGGDGEGDLSMGSEMGTPNPNHTSNNHWDREGPTPVLGGKGFEKMTRHSLDGLPEAAEEGTPVTSSLATIPGSGPSTAPRGQQQRLEESPTRSGNPRNESPRTIGGTPVNRSSRTGGPGNLILDQISPSSLSSTSTNNSPQQTTTTPPPGSSSFLKSMRSNRAAAVAAAVHAHSNSSDTTGSPVIPPGSPMSFDLDRNTGTKSVTSGASIRSGGGDSAGGRGGTGVSQGIEAELPPLAPSPFSKNKKFKNSLIGKNKNQPPKPVPTSPSKQQPPTAPPKSTARPPMATSATSSSSIQSNDTAKQSPLIGSGASVASSGPMSVDTVANNLPPGKRQSMLRSAGTASSPDLGNLAKKDAVAVGSGKIVARPTPDAGEDTGNDTEVLASPPKPSSNGSPNLGNTRGPHPPPSPSATQSSTLRTSNASSFMGVVNRDRSLSYNSALHPTTTISTISSTGGYRGGGIAGGASDHRDSESIGSGKEFRGLPTSSGAGHYGLGIQGGLQSGQGAVQGGGTGGLGARKKSNIEEKGTIRSRARGMFGRMFGGSSSNSDKISQHQTGSQFNLSQHNLSSQNSTPRQPQTAPPVPNMSSSFSAQSIASMQRDKSVDSAGKYDSSNELAEAIRRASLASSGPGYEVVTPAGTVTPTPAQHSIANKRISMDRSSPVIASITPEKPLPEIQQQVKTPEQSPARYNEATPVSKHVRQPADGEEVPLADGEQQPIAAIPHAIAMSRSESSSPARQLRQWTDEMEDRLEGQGVEKHLAQELGLPPASVRVDSPSRQPVKRIPLPKLFAQDVGASPGDVSAAPPSPTPTLTPFYNPRSISPAPEGSPSLGSALATTPRSNAVAGDIPAPKTPPVVLGRSSSLTSEDKMMAQLPVRTASQSSRRSGEATKDDTSEKEVLATVNLDEEEKVGPAVEETTPTKFGERKNSVADSLDEEVQKKSPVLDDPFVVASRTPPESTLSLSTPWGAMASPNRISRQSPRIEAKPEPTEEELEEQGRSMAEEFFNDDESRVASDRVAEHLGGIKPVSKYTLRFYMQYFDFAGIKLDEAFRRFCQKLYLKAETQEIDRILEGFSLRYFQCNPETIFGSPTVIHVVTGSFLLLNTDLHIADINQHMSRSQFVKLTIETIYANIQPQISDRASTPDLMRDDGSISSQAISGPSLPTGVSPSSRAARTTSMYSNSSLNSSAIAPSVGSGLAAASHSTLQPGQEAKPRLGSSTSFGSVMYQKGWESDLEVVLKDIFAGVKSNQILLPVSNPVLPSNRLLSPSSPYNNRRTSQRGPSGASTDRVNALKRGSVRGMQSLLGANSYPNFGSNGDGRISPTPSYATSINDAYAFSLNQPTLGFASNLSHAVIREQEDEGASVVSNGSDSTADEMTDDDLALLGAPWAKEGNLSRKPYWDAPGKRSKVKEWKQTFVVIQKGDLHMFTFGQGSSSGSAVGVGGGNWMANAKGQGDMNLSHSLASALPPPGYNQQRPYCFSLTLPGGEMSFFQAGTEDLVQEWVATCNYWAARRSRPPLPGGLGNSEYGWSRLLENPNAHDERDDAMSMRSNRSARSRLSVQATMGRRYAGSSNSADGININEWKAPQASLIPSPLDEETQLESLQKHIKSLKADLDQHKTIEEPMMRMYTARSPNGIKARENWRTKSFFIHSEIVKYETYVDSLKAAISLRVKKQGDRKLERSLAVGGVEADEEEEDYSPVMADSEFKIDP